jgi:tetratricopeptide (TPR) repeat protein
VTGLVVDGTGFEVLAGGERIGSRRALGPADVEWLEGLAAKYVRAVQAGSDAGVFVGLGRELFGWLDGDQGQLSRLLEQAVPPLVFEIQGSHSPSDEAWAVLRAPFELLARPDGGFLAEDALARFCVVRRLGQPGQLAALDEFRLGLAFMASAPRGQHDLDFEAEEAAILNAVGESRVDLLVEDTGDPEQLAHRLADLGGMPVLHLSCHGLNSFSIRPGTAGVPVLMMENELGGERPTTAGDLVTMLPVPRLLFVSACLTATGADAAGHLPPGHGHRGDQNPAADGKGLVAHSLATALVTAGVPAVIGWDGSVGDRAATLFAERLYRGLADHVDVAVAVGDARRRLLDSDDLSLRSDWHLARLWLGPAGGGPLVAGTQKRTLVSATRGTKIFLDRKHHVLVAAPEMFVGRRPELQQALRALRLGERAGVLLHGQGRLGKSSLAARIADRFPDRAVAVVFGDYSALAILDAVATAVSANQLARELIEQRRPEVRQRPEAIEAVLVDLLTGPCAQANGGQRPLLLIIDDLEQILVADPAGPHRVKPEHAAVLVAVLRAFHLAETESRLLLTSRFIFRLDGLEARLEQVQLRPLSEVAQHKLQRRQQALTSPQRLVERSDLADRALQVSRGNPGLQDLIGLRIVYGEQVPVSRAEAAVAGLEAYLAQGDLPDEAEVRAFLENLALDTLLEEAGSSNVALLRAATLFELPVPESVIELLADHVGGSVARLRGLGLLDPYQDLYDATRLALAVNPLAAGRLEPLTAEEQPALAKVTVTPLFTAWGGTTAQSGWARELDLQLTVLGLLGDDPTVVAASAADAVRLLRNGPAADALQLGEEAVGLLDRHDQAVTLDLLRAAAEAALTSGDGGKGDALLERAIRQAEAVDQEEAVDPLDRARVVRQRARRLMVRGELDRAEQLLQQAHQLFTTQGSEQEAAVAMGDIADIAYRRGDVKEAERIRRDIVLPVYERLGDNRSVAVTWGRIADIAYMRGNYNEAERISREVVLPVYQRLGDTRSAAITWGRIADIAFRRGEYDKAERIRRDVELPVYERLGDTRSAAITWGEIADIAYLRGDYDEAERIRQEIELPIYERLGDTRSTAVAWNKIANIALSQGNYEKAVELQLKVLEVNKQLRDVDGIAAATWDLAQIDLAQENYATALPRLRESYEILRQLQRADAIAIVGTTLGELLLDGGATEEAQQVLDASLAAATKIGHVEAITTISTLLNRLNNESEET